MARNVRTIEPFAHLIALTAEGFGVIGDFVIFGLTVAFTLALGVGEAFEVIFGEGLTEALAMYFDKSISPPSLGDGIIPRPRDSMNTFCIPALPSSLASGILKMPKLDSTAPINGLFARIPNPVETKATDETLDLVFAGKVTRI